jgi:hypothetical protein
MDLVIGSPSRRGDHSILDLLTGAVKEEETDI